MQVRTPSYQVLGGPSTLSWLYLQDFTRFWTWRSKNDLLPFWVRVRKKKKVTILKYAQGKDPIKIFSLLRKKGNVTILKNTQGKSNSFEISLWNKGQHSKGKFIRALHVVLGEGKLASYSPSRLLASPKKKGRKKAKKYFWRLQARAQAHRKT